MVSEASISASDWMKGISLSIAASIIGGASKLAIRKSWLMVEHLPELDSPSLLPLLGFPSTLTDRIYSKNNSYADSNPIRESQNTTISEQSKSHEHIELSSFEKQKHPPHSHMQYDEHSDPITNTEYMDSVSNSPPDNSMILQRRSVLLRLCGMFGMAVLNPVCCIWAMVYASPSVLAPFSGLTLVWIVLFSEYFVNERPLPSQILAAALIVLGEIITAIFGDHTNDKNVTLDNIMQSYLDPKFIGFFIGLLVWLMFLYFLINYSSSNILKRFAWGVSGGSVNGLQNFLKDGLTGASATPAGQHYPLMLYLFLLGGIVSALSGLLLLTASMKRYDATYSSSMFVGSFVISASIMSAVHYHTFQNLETAWNYALYPAGLLVLLSGVIVLAFTQKPYSETNPTNHAVNQRSSNQYHQHGSDFIRSAHYSQFDEA